MLEIMGNLCTGRRRNVENMAEKPLKNVNPAVYDTKNIFNK